MANEAERGEAERIAIVEEDAAEGRSLRADEQAELDAERAGGRLTRRAVLAAIALAPAPVPESVKFNDAPRTGTDGQPLDSSISIDLGDDMHAFREWCALLGVEDDWVRHQTYTPADQSGEPFEIWNAVVFRHQWGYRQIRLNADEPSSPAEEPLPADQVTALSEVATEREAGE